MDRISLFPDDFLLHILSLLPTKDVLTTSVLSKRWRNLWKLVPKLVYIDINNKAEHWKFLQFVDRSLLLNKAPVLWSLHFKLNRQYRDVDIGFWIRNAVERGLGELNFDYCCAIDTPRRMPQSLFTCKTLVALKLKKVSLVDVQFPVCFQLLKTLHLVWVIFRDDESSQQLLSRCPALEVLVLKRVTNDNVATFSVMLPSLQRLVYDSTGLKDPALLMNTPSLKDLKIVDFSYECMVENVPEIVEAHVKVSCSNIGDILRSLAPLKRLLLCLPSESPFPTGTIFYQLVHLEFCTCVTEWDLLMSMLQHSPKLRSLKLNETHGHFCGVPSFHWDEPSTVPETLMLGLRTLEWRSYRGGNRESQLATEIYMDRISLLPNDFLLHILSLLPTKDVLTTSVLSQRWRYLWKLVPKLEYCDIDEYAADYRSFLRFVDRSLLSNTAPVLESLHFKLDQECSEVDIGFWIRTALERGLRELNLDYRFDPIRLPQSLYTCGTLVVLKLKHVSLVDVRFPVCFGLLKTLHLLYVDDKTAQKLLSSCPVLEVLVLHRADGDNVFRFSVKVPSLQIFIYESGYESEELVLNTPSLKYLKTTDNGLKCMIEYMPEIVEAHVHVTCCSNAVILMISLKSVKRLSLCLQPEVEFPTGSIFHQLVHLELYTCETDWWVLMLMLQHSPKLRSLKLNMIHNNLPGGPPIFLWEEPSSVPETLMFVLETFEWRNYRGWKKKRDLATLYTCVTEWDLLMSMLQHSPKLRSLKLNETHGHFCGVPSFHWDEPSTVPETLMLGLRTLEWRSYRGGNRESQLATYILKHSRRLKIATFSPHVSRLTTLKVKYDMITELARMSRGSTECELVFG